LGELAHVTLQDDFRAIDPRQATIVLLEGSERILGAFLPALSAKAETALRRLGVTVRTRTLVTDLHDSTVTMRRGDSIERLQARTIFWTAGVKSSALGEALAQRTGAERDRTGRIKVAADFTIPGHPEIFLIGDLAHFARADGSPLPGLASVAIQEGRYVGTAIRQRVQGKTPRGFQYVDKGSLAIIGRNAAVAEVGRVHLHGFPAWLLWLFVHIYFLIGFDNKLLVLVQWAWNYVTRKRGAQLITGREPR
jgi:NADH dehydrogenase